MNRRAGGWVDGWAGGWAERRAGRGAGGRTHLQTGDGRAHALGYQHNVVQVKLELLGVFALVLARHIQHHPILKHTRRHADRGADRQGQRQIKFIRLCKMECMMKPVPFSKKDFRQQTKCTIIVVDRELS